jgi:hypothetical protein
VDSAAKGKNQRIIIGPSAASPANHLESLQTSLVGSPGATELLLDSCCESASRTLVGKGQSGRFAALVVVFKGFCPRTRRLRRGVINKGEMP